MARRHIRTSDYAGIDRRGGGPAALLRWWPVLGSLGVLVAGYFGVIREVDNRLVKLEGLAMSNREAVSLLRQRENQDIAEIKQELRLLRQELSLSDRRRNP